MSFEGETQCARIVIKLMESEFRRLPSVDKLIADSRVKQCASVYPHEFIVGLIRQHLERERLSIAAGNPGPSFDNIVNSLCAQLRSLEKPTLLPVINATGVVLHTNLGRAPLSRETMAVMEAVARGYCNLEFEVDSGTRGSRQRHIELLLCQLTGAEAALVVNNNAAAVLLGLAALAKKKEVIVSRGQAVEIGGGFRIPDVMRQSGAKLVEVGTTNCTYARDYEEAITPHTAVLLRVHSSNFLVTGFTHAVGFEELVTIGHRCNLPVFDDLGSGCLLDTAPYGLAPEPMVQKSVAAGAALVFFSGDKLVGGPQAGIIVGKKELIQKLARHPLARAVRIDKIRLAGLTATLTHYLKGEALQKIPVWEMIAMPLAQIEQRAQTWSDVLGGFAEVTEGQSMIGGGSLPGSTLPTRLVAVRGRGKNKAQALAQKLRQNEPPVIGRISEDILLLDPRSVLPGEDKIVIKSLRSLATTLKNRK